MPEKSKEKIEIVTLGCSKNRVDSEVLIAQLRAGGCDVSHDRLNGSASTVIINTCGFIDNAKQESIDTILHYAGKKKSGDIDRLIVTGCLSERYKPWLLQEIPEVDAYFGTHDLPDLLSQFNVNYKHELVGERQLTTPSHYAYLKISEGCDRKCSFCAIPLMRGGHVSKTMEAVASEAKNLAVQGVKEAILIAQDLTYYGLDIYGKRNLALLLKKLTEVNGIEWIRLHYAYPAGFPIDVLDVMRDFPKICNYLDIPFQHISDRLLRSMRRGLNRDKTLRLIETIRKKVPGIALRTTLIAGYPGETNNDFRELCRFIRDTRFERLGIFTYSHEENTHAYILKDDVPQKIKEQRVEEIMHIQQEIAHELNRDKIGNVLRVLIDRKEGDNFIGRTEHDSPEVDNEVLISAEGGYQRIGDFAKVRITGASEYDLYGSPVSVV